MGIEREAGLDLVLSREAADEGSQQETPLEPRGMGTPTWVPSKLSSDQLGGRGGLSLIQ